MFLAFARARLTGIDALVGVRAFDVGITVAPRDVVCTVFIDLGHSQTTRLGAAWAYKKGNVTNVACACCCDADPRGHNDGCNG